MSVCVCVCMCVFVYVFLLQYRKKLKGIKNVPSMFRSYKREEWSDVRSVSGFGGS